MNTPVLKTDSTFAATQGFQALTDALRASGTPFRLQIEDDLVPQKIQTEGVDREEADRIGSAIQTRLSATGSTAKVSITPEDVGFGVSVQFPTAPTTEALRAVLFETNEAAPIRLSISRETGA